MDDTCAISKCTVCIHRKNSVMCNGMYDPYDWDSYGCCDHEYFEADKLRIIAVAKELGISISDLIALINL